MKELLIHFRVLSMFSQHAHQLAKGPLFFQDHCFLGEVYEAANSDYDAVSERIIGTMGCEHVNLHEIARSAFKELLKLPANEVKQNSEFFEVILELESKTCMLVDQICKEESTSEGTKQLVGEMSNQAEARKYKIKQRLKK